MSPPVPEDPIAEYVTVLRGFGLDDREIVELHDQPAGVEDPDPVAHLRVSLEGPDPEALFDRLHTVLAESDRGISAPFEYWHSVPPVQLGDLLEPYGYRIDVEHRGEGSAAPFRITVEDRVAGRTRVREFRYPAGPLGENNYPALVHTVEDMLDRGGPTFVLLTARDERWRFVLAPHEDLADLRERYGHRVEVFGAPLLSAYEPADFRGGAPESAAERRTEAVPGPIGEREAAGSVEADTGGRSDDEVPKHAPEWLRSAAATEGGVDALVESLKESGPRTHVSGRTADDILGEVPGDVDPDTARTTTGSGIDEVFETLEASASVDPGPSKVVADRTVEDVFEMIDEPAPDDPGAGGRSGTDPESVLDTDDAETDSTAGVQSGGEATARSPGTGAGAPDGRTPDGDDPDDPLDSLVGADPEPTVVEQGPEVEPSDADRGADTAAGSGSTESADPETGSNRGGDTTSSEPEDRPARSDPARSAGSARNRDAGVRGPPDRERPREDVMEIGVGGDFESLLADAGKTDPEEMFETLAESEEADPEEFLPDVEDVDPDELVEQAEADPAAHDGGDLDGFLGGSPGGSGPDDASRDAPTGSTGDGGADHVESTDPAVADVIEHVGEDEGGDADRDPEPDEESILAGSGIRDAESKADTGSGIRDAESWKDVETGAETTDPGEGTAPTGDTATAGSDPGSASTPESTANPGSASDDSAATGSGDGSEPESGSDSTESPPSIVAGVGATPDRPSSPSDEESGDGPRETPPGSKGDEDEDAGSGDEKTEEDQPDMESVLASIENDDEDDGDGREGLLDRIRSLFDRITP